MRRLVLRRRDSGQDCSLGTTPSHLRVVVGARPIPVDGDSLLDPVAAPLAVVSPGRHPARRRVRAAESRHDCSTTCYNPRHRAGRARGM